MFPPLVTPPRDPLPLETLDVRVLPRTLGPMVGEGRARDAVRRRPLRPGDLDAADESPVERLWVPLWRVEGSASGVGMGFTVGAPAGPDVGVLGGGGPRPPRSPRRRRPGLLPKGQIEHHDGVERLIARRGYAIDPSLRARLPLNELRPFAEALLSGDPAVLPDVPQTDAEGLARHAFERRARPQPPTLVASVDVHLRSAILCFYPLYVLRYRYRGDAVDGEAVFFAAVSGVTGKVVASHHPGALRSVGTRLRDLFGRE